jgi:DNA-binding transcriptional ArsR family regulator
MHEDGMSLNGNRAKSLDLTFDALADATRRSMLDRLRRSPLTVTELARPCAMSLNGASKHIKKLEKAGLIRRSIRGREHLCALDASGLDDAMNWMRHYSIFWSERIDALETYVTVKRKRGEK